MAERIWWIIVALRGWDSTFGRKRRPLTGTKSGPAIPEIRRFCALWAVLLLILAGGAIRQAHGGDQVVVTIGPEIEVDSGNGRLLLLFAPAIGGGNTLGAPFWNNPQPVYSIAIEQVGPGSRWVIDDTASGSFPGPLSELEGTFRVRAVLDLDSTTSGFGFSDRNWISAERRLRLRRGAVDVVSLEIIERMPVAVMKDTAHVKEAKLRSEKLSAFFGRDVFLRAGVILPAGYQPLSGRKYPTVYEIPGFGEQHASAWDRGRAPEALGDGVVWIVLDADGPFGHHLFFNSENNGPVGDALVEEFIPYLEQTYGLVSSAAGRVVTGHSSGGFASAWLQIRYPEFFGSCWSTGPDPLDFQAFQVIDIYTDANAYEDAHGQERPSIHIDSKVACTIRQENGMENAMDPAGASGQQWDSWMACFSPRADNGMPMELWDARTGALNHEAVHAWRRNDPRLYIESNWDRIGPALCDRLHIICGSADNFSLHLAARRLRSALAAMEGWPGLGFVTADVRARGYVEIVPQGTHFNLGQVGVTARIHEEMRRHFEAHGLLEKQ